MDGAPFDVQNIESTPVRDEIKAPEKNAPLR